MLIYFAGPLFCQAEQEFNARLAEKLENLGFTVFLPQRDGAVMSKEPYSTMPVDELRRAIFKLDREKLLEADIFLFILDGRVPDDGACVELGMAYAQKFLLERDKLIIGFQTDWRSAFAFLDTKLNPIILGAFDEVAENEDDLIKALQAYQQAKVKV